MPAVRKSVSITTEMDEFCRRNSISPSRVLQAELYRLMRGGAKWKTVKGRAGQH